MRIADDLFPHIVVGNLSAPGLRPAEEDALVAAEPVDHRRGRALERGMIGIERERDAAEVGDVLAHGQRAVDVGAATA